MSIDVPSSRIPIRAADFRYGRPILSGDSALDRYGGLKGLNSEINHAYAHKLQVQAENWTRDPTKHVFETTSTSYVQASYKVSVWAPKDLTALRLTVWCSRATVMLRTSQGDSADSSTIGATAAAATVDWTPYAATGAFLTAYIRVKATAGHTAKIYGWRVEDVALDAADFPA